MVTVDYVVGVDVGTGSVRAALVDCANGQIVRMAHAPITTFNPSADLFHQSSNNIWMACSTVVKEVTSCVEKESVKGIAFDATCSLVVLDRQGQPLTVSPHGDGEQNVILWLDHRASEEVSLINKTAHKLLSYVGGKMSVEMQLPKLLWLKNNLKDICWDKAGYFFDLADFLTWKSTGSNTRSLCTVTCKWAFDAVSNNWDKSFMESIGLDDLLKDDCCKIGSVMQAPGMPCGSGLTNEAASDLGLLAGTCVATSIIDAHAGVLGMAAVTPTIHSSSDTDSVPTTHSSTDTDSTPTPALESRLSVICGTSTCLMALSERAVYVAGVWGPYVGSVLGLPPHTWLLEGGQSATGKLLDHVIATHPATAAIRLTENVSISGMSLSTTEEDLALRYLAVIQSLAYSTKQIVDGMESAGHTPIELVAVCGGLAQNGLYVQVLANVLHECQLLVPVQQNAMLAGCAMLAATAGQCWPTLTHAMHAMATTGNHVTPQPATFKYHSKKYKVFLQMVEDQKNYKRIMES